MPFEPRLVRPDEDPADSAGSFEVRASETSHEPHAVAGDADAGDRWLPVELEALAEQLGEDSQHLAQRYPAPVYAETPSLPSRFSDLAARMEQAAAQAESRRSAFRTWRRVAALASTLAAAVLVAAGVGLWLSGSDERVNSVAIHSADAGESGSNSAKNVAANETSESRLATREPVTLVAPSRPNLVPVLEPQDFMELDSVTQSAVADLVEDGQLQQGAISL